MSATYNLNVGASTLIDGTGAGTATLAPGSYERWNVTRIAVLTNDAPNVTKIPQANVYVDSVAPENFLAGTYSGNKDQSDENLTLERGQHLICVWSGGNTGTTATLSVFGTRETY